MKKTILAIVSGMFLGLLLVAGVFSVLHFQNGGNIVLAQNMMSTQNKIESPELLNLAVGTSNNMTAGILDTYAEIEKAASEMITVEEERRIEAARKAEEARIAEELRIQNLPYYIKVNRYANTVTVYGKDANGFYTVPVKAMVCSVGLDGATPLGIGSITDKYDWRLLFGNVWGQYSVRFNGHIMFHSVPYTTTSKDALKEGEYNKLGSPASQGCIRLSVIDAKWIYDNCDAGTKVEVYDDVNPGPWGKPASIYVDPTSPIRGWDPTDPDPANPW